MDGISGEELTGHQLSSRAIKLAKALQQQCKIKSSDVISICSENRIEYALTIHAAILLGAIVAPFNSAYTECKYCQAHQILLMIYDCSLNQQMKYAMDCIYRNRKYYLFRIRLTKNVSTLRENVHSSNY